jgi:hypothetical protein
MNSVDRIFSEKLEGHTSAPPAGAWEKVEMVVSKRPTTNHWRWAAVLIPIVIAAGWMLTRTEDSSPETLTSNVPVSVVPAPVAATQEAKTAPQPLVVRKKTVQPIGPITPTLTRVSETIISNPETSSPETITIEPVELIAEVAEPITPMTADKEPMVIVITLEPIAQAPDAEKKPLEKVAEFAMAVKHSDPIGSLRTVKDELFALDLRKKSTKKN